MQYVNATLPLRMRSWRSESDKLESIHPDLYADADFAGDAKDSKSTNGGYYHLSAANTQSQVSAIFKKQTCVSHSTPESELVSADHAIRNDVLPTLELIELILGKPQCETPRGQ